MQRYEAIKMDNGEVFFTQTYIANICGVTQPNMSNFFKKSAGGLTLNKNRELSHRSLEVVLWTMAFRGRKNNKALFTYHTFKDCETVGEFLRDMNTRVLSWS